ncbi:MAG: alanine dehydrogenase, partial [Rubrobacteraceae bacterium]|nr:alanine dehydrogenase [Rubrobacteraceae bacterium]
MPMTIGVPKEIKDQEGRVALQPDGAAELTHHGHSVLIEKGAGEASGFADEEYLQAGARIEKDKKRLFSSSDLILKVKEPLPEEYPLFKEGQQLFTYLHLAAD